MVFKATNTNSVAANAQTSKKAIRRASKKGSRVTQERAKAQRAKLDAQAEARHLQKEEKEAIVFSTQNKNMARQDREAKRRMIETLIEAYIQDHIGGRYCQLAEKQNLWHTDGMKRNATAPNYKGFRFPPEIISHAVWLYFRFSLSFRDVEELLAQRGFVVSYETVRQWCFKFGQTSANEVRGRRPHCGDTWHSDEVVLSIRGQKHSLWRAVDQDGTVLDILVQSRRNKKAAKRFFRKLLKELHSVQRVIITDKLKSYGAAKREILPGVEHRQQKRLNNRAENSHQPTRLREKKMRRFKSAKHAQRFLSADRAHL